MDQSQWNALNEMLSQSSADGKKSISDQTGIDLQLGDQASLAGTGMYRRHELAQVCIRLFVCVCVRVCVCKRLV